MHVHKLKVVIQLGLLKVTYQNLLRETYHLPSGYFANGFQMFIWHYKSSYVDIIFLPPLAT